MSGMAFRPRRGRGAVTLNVTSLIDVLFLLLIFFMLTGTFKRVGELELKLPESQSATAAADQPQGAEVVLTEDGRLMFEERALPVSELAESLRAWREGHPQGEVTIKAEAGVEHGRVVAVLDVVREAGFPGVGIGTHRRLTPATP